MAGRTEHLYRIQKKEIPRAGLVLADAFQYDEVWQLFFKPDATLEQKSMLFQSPVKYCYKYGKAFALSDKLEGITGWVPGDFADMTAWRLVKSGAIINGIKALSACTKLAQKQAKIFKPLEEDRKVTMKGRKYIYLLIVGVKAELQGQGIGKKLLQAPIEESEQAGIPIYTETQTANNVSFYERLGFRQIRKIIMPIINLPQWELIREPGT
jgi:ribosomal protein S18 acetylase RimI-like enzyme